MIWKLKKLRWQLRIDGFRFTFRCTILDKLGLRRKKEPHWANGKVVHEIQKQDIQPSKIDDYWIRDDLNDAIASGYIDSSTFCTGTANQFITSGCYMPYWGQTYTGNNYYILNGTT